MYFYKTLHKFLITVDLFDFLAATYDKHILTQNRCERWLPQPPDSPRDFPSAPLSSCGVAINMEPSGVVNSKINWSCHCQPRKKMIKKKWSTSSWGIIWIYNRQWQIRLKRFPTKHVYNHPGGDSYWAGVKPSIIVKHTFRESSKKKAAENVSADLNGKPH